EEDIARRLVLFDELEAEVDAHEAEGRAEGLLERVGRVVRRARLGVAGEPRRDRHEAYGQRDPHRTKGPLRRHARRLRSRAGSGQLPGPTLTLRALRSPASPRPRAPRPRRPSSAWSRDP